jgi:hypothetical protein
MEEEKKKKDGRGTCLESGNLRNRKFLFNFHILLLVVWHDFRPGKKLKKKMFVGEPLQMF